MFNMDNPQNYSLNADTKEHNVLWFQDTGPENSL